jgi:hypothetical protein
MRIFLLWIVITILAGCRTTNLVGTYQSNCADIGFFVTTVTLKADSTFEYRFKGDLANNFGTGTFEVSNDILELSFDKDIIADSMNIAKLLNPSPKEPLYYKTGNNKLWVINNEGKVVRTANCYSRTRRFIFWGDEFMTRRRYFLKKTE